MDRRQSCLDRRSGVKEGNELEHQADEGMENPMIVRWLLFETRVGELLLTILERKVGLAIVQAEWLAAQPAGEPKAAGQAQ